jgi:hypothetical protein
MHLKFTSHMRLCLIGTIANILAVGRTSKYLIEYSAFDGGDTSHYNSKSWCLQHVALNLPDNAVEITPEMYQMYEVME